MRNWWVACICVYTDCVFEAWTCHVQPRLCSSEDTCVCCVLYCISITSVYIALYNCVFTTYRNSLERYWKDVLWPLTTASAYTHEHVAMLLLYWDFQEFLPSFNKTWSHVRTETLQCIIFLSYMSLLAPLLQSSALQAYVTRESELNGSPESKKVTCPFHNWSNWEPLKRL